MLRSLPASRSGVARILLRATTTLSGLVFGLVVRTVARHTGAAMLLLRRLVARLLAAAGLISPVLLCAAA